MQCHAMQCNSMTCNTLHCSALQCHARYRAATLACATWSNGAACRSSSEALQRGEVLPDERHHAHPEARGCGGPRGGDQVHQLVLRDANMYPWPKKLPWNSCLRRYEKSYFTQFSAGFTQFCGFSEKSRKRIPRAHAVQGCHFWRGRGTPAAGCPSTSWTLYGRVAILAIYYLGKYMLEILEICLDCKQFFKLLSDM